MTRKRKGNGTSSGGTRRLVRNAHIFASTIREILEIKQLRKATRLPVSLSQFHVLRLMTLNGQHQVGEVADFLGVSPPAATKNIDKLEKLGLISRRPSEGDRRATLLTVSPKGRGLVRKYESLRDECLGAALQSFPPDGVNQLADLLEEFFVSLLKSESDGKANGFCLRCAAYLDTGCPVGRLRGGCPYLKTCGPGEPEPSEGEAAS